MTSSDEQPARIARVDIDDDRLTVELTDGRTVGVPLAFYPALLSATKAQRRNWRLIARGSGVHWPDVDEDLSLDGILQGIPSAVPARRLAG